MENRRYIYNKLHNLVKKKCRIERSQYSHAYGNDGSVRRANVARSILAVSRLKSQQR